jgi:2-oxoglutarate dehydrogenase E1 component
MSTIGSSQGGGGTFAARANLELTDEQYRRWRSDPGSVSVEWAAFFEGFSLGLSRVEEEAGQAGGQVVAGGDGGAALRVTQTDRAFRARLMSMVYAFRTVGHVAAWIDPLDDGPPEDSRLDPATYGFVEADMDREVASVFYRGGKPMVLRDMVDELRRIYCGRIGFEFMHIHNPEVRSWMQERIEGRLSEELDVAKYEKAFRWLVSAEAFEGFLHRRYVGQKRFSVEGGEALLVGLQGILEACEGHGVEEIVMGMAHRGRLTTLANFLEKPLKTILYEFSENYVPELVGGDGDVKYHLGYETRRRLDSGHEVSIYLAANPSHLEAVNPVVEGQARARQRIIGDAGTRSRVLPLLIHGDAAMAGQGVVAEILNSSQLPGYRTGGTVHLVVNNQIGFTTTPEDARSSAYCTDVMKLIEAPVMHVNGDDPMEVLFAVELALEFRQAFQRDVAVDIVCYRRHGHNEGDEPSFTQPNFYRKIAQHPSPATVFRKRLEERGVIEPGKLEGIVREAEGRLEKEYEELKEAEKAGGGRARIFEEAIGEAQQDYWYELVVTGWERGRFRELGRKLNRVPEEFQLNPTIRRRFLAGREKAVAEGGPYDWSHAEALAFGSLLVEGHGVRLSGQDSRRGTFSQRHSVLFDMETRETYVPLRQLSEDQASFCVYNSQLSEASVLGFDYGYSLMAPDMLICWEAQFGDFVNGAQVIVDQFLSSAESKWQQPSGLVLLLPHGYEGQGPEHSSARLERFLQLCAEGNLQVCNLTTPAQYFHVLRRQMVRLPYRKPLILMTPKSMLRHPQAVSVEDDFVGESAFSEILDDEQLIETTKRVTRLIFCSGKVYYDLLNYRNENKIRNVAIIRIEQLYPFHWDKLDEIVGRYPRANKKWVWCQEEPLNMGAWSYIFPRLQQAAGHSAYVRYAGRERAASPAAGSKAVHVRQQRRLVEQAFSV